MEPKPLLLGVAVLFLYVLIISLFARLGRKGSAIAFGLGAPVALLLGYFTLRVDRPRAPAPAAVQYPDGRRERAVLQGPAAGEPAAEAFLAGGPAWVTRWRDAERPGPRGELVGLSKLEPTREEALRGARLAAREKLQRLVRGRFEERARRPIDGGAAAPWIDASVERFLADPGARKDLFEESVKLPQSGEVVYRAAVLLELPGRRIDALAEEALKDLEAVQGAERSRLTRLGWTLLSALLLALVTFIVYSFLNAGSKGHLAWTLRIASIAAYLLVCLGLFFLRGHLP